MIGTGFSEIAAIGTFGNFVYVADSQDGFFAIESFAGDEFSKPRNLGVKVDGASVHATTMVLVTLGSILNTTVSVATSVFLLASLSLFWTRNILATVSYSLLQTLKNDDFCL